MLRAGHLVSDLRGGNGGGGIEMPLLAILNMEPNICNENLTNSGQ